MVNSTKKQRSCKRNDFFASFLMILSLVLSNFGVLNARNNCPDQTEKLSAEEYCRLYAHEARRQMEIYGIPASITLAQGMFESAYGSSYIAVVANNHFGIKAYRGWNGPVVNCDDDNLAEPFCKFNSAIESFEYHSNFLKNNSRYASLFKLRNTDYKGWAYGLSKCGYATNPKYPSQLIDIIERYNLQVYDKGESYVKTGASSINTSSRKATSSNSAISSMSHRHPVYRTNPSGGLKYILAEKEDNIARISVEFGISMRKLYRYNDLPSGYRITEGEVIYLQKKRSKADARYMYHDVKEGESLQQISQRYGVTVKSIVKRNKLATANVRVGQRLCLR